MTGLSRTMLSELCRRVDPAGRPAIKTMRLKLRPGATRVALLISRSSLLQYLDAEADKQASELMTESARADATITVTETQLATDQQLWRDLIATPAKAEGRDWSFGNLNTPMLRRAGMVAIGLVVNSSPAGQQRAITLLDVHARVRDKVRLSARLNARVTHLLRTRRSFKRSSKKDRAIA